MSLPGSLHLAAAGIALATGTAALLLPKGTRRHRLAGGAFVLAMAVACGSALCLHRITGHPNLFHALAVLDLAAVAWAMAPFLRRRPGFAARHARRMPGAFVGLCAAAANEFLFRVALPRMPAAGNRFWTVSMAVTAAMTLSGLLLARHHRLRTPPVVTAP